ncbi:hypothetical protein F5Y07DRAFT_374824 [Xylaria sp. FL0933]|nr:hypothetical protein F5Y07DRAFT_374824 [Xylaria sp. FL0933]
MFLTPSHGYLNPPAQCLVAAGLRGGILSLPDADHAERIQSYWRNSAKLRLVCTMQPQFASEVATAGKSLADADQVFAVRSGGHMNWADSNNIDSGLTIDRLNNIRYDAASVTAYIGPGAKWKDVYEELEKHGRVVAGGRETGVGVGGFLLGGGNSFHSVKTTPSGQLWDGFTVHIIDVLPAAAEAITDFATPSSEDADVPLSLVLARLLLWWSV